MSLLEKPVLKTDNLILRELNPKDVDDLEWLSDMSLYKYWGKRPSKSDLNPKFMDKDTPSKATKSFHWGIVHKIDNKVIGEFWVYLIENDRMAKIAYRLSSEYQGKELMTEALRSVISFCFENTELQRLWTDVDINNILDNCGFTREACIRQGKMVSTYLRLLSVWYAKIRLSKYTIVE